MDLSTGFDFPNPFGLKAQDFDYDQDAYGVALRFLSDMSSGTEETLALEANGGTAAMLREWERSARFRRVLHKCRNAGEENRRYMERHAQEQESDAQAAQGPRFVPLDQMPVRRGSIFSQTPNIESWGDGSLNLPG